MYSSVFEQAVLLIGAGAACLAAIFAILSYFRPHQPTDFLTATGAAQLLRSETEIVRASIDDHGRGLRQELGQSFGILREGIDSQVRGFGERLDEAASKAVEMRIRSSAKDICDKYVHPPHSTDFAVLFLPTEGLFAEIIRRPGLVDTLQRECRIVVTGPTTLMALLNSLRMGFRTLAIQKRSSEVWQVLAAVKTEFGKYGEILDKVQQKLHEASNTIDKVSVRRRAIDRRLRGVEILPEMEAGAILTDLLQLRRGHVG